MRRCQVFNTSAGEAVLAGDKAKKMLVTLSGQHDARQSDFFTAFRIRRSSLCHRGVNILYGVDQLHAVAHRFFKRFTTENQPHPARTLIDDRRTYGIRQVSFTARRATGVNQSGASHIAVRQLITDQIDRILRGQLAIDAIVSVTKVHRLIAAVIFRHFLLHDISANGGRQPRK